MKPNHNGGQRRQALFPLGRLVATPGAIEAMAPYENIALRLVGRHVTGDWGQVCAQDWALNDKALLEGTRLLSAYILPDDETKVWIISEADRSATTILLLSEY